MRMSNIPNSRNAMLPTRENYTHLLAIVYHPRLTPSLLIFAHSPINSYHPIFAYQGSKTKNKDGKRTFVRIEHPVSFLPNSVLLPLRVFFTSIDSLNFHLSILFGPPENRLNGKPSS